MGVIERPFSDLLRHPKDVANDVEVGDVVLRRRDGPDLRLSRADRDADRNEAVDALARALRGLAVHNPAALGLTISEAFPWADLLPSKDRALFVDDVTRTLAGTAALDSHAPLTQLIREWRATAEIHADPALAKRLRRRLEAAGARVAPPAAS